MSFDAKVLSADRAWHAEPAPQVLASLAAAEMGLTSAEAQQRLQSVGPNQLPQQPPPTIWQIIWRQVQSPLIYVLLFAVVASMSMGDFKDALFIAIVIIINTVIGAYQEWRAEQSSRALQKLLHIRASVLRDGDIVELDAEDVVPGDIVWLESGQRVPADMRLLTAHGLEIDESLLTGESLAVLKNTKVQLDHATPIGDRLNMTYAGSIVVRGRGSCVVVATGSKTMIGALALEVASAGGGQPPLLERMERFSRVIAVAAVGGAILIAALGVLIHGYAYRDMLFFAIALAVSVIPEGLPAALTVALSVATTRMARRGVIIRRLAAVEGLGSCTLIASDKTGTLTCNQLTVRDMRLTDGRRFDVSGEGYHPIGQITNEGRPVEPQEKAELDYLARAAVLCNEGDLHQRNGEWVWHGDPTDIALLSMAHKLGRVRETTLEAHPQINQIPFEPEHRFAATYHSIEGKNVVIVKGAPERVLAMCSWQESDASDRLHALAESMAKEGYRVLAFAEGSAPDNLDASVAPPEPSGCRFLGFVGMIDPLRPGVPEAIAACHDAGVRVCMITGDHPATALAIARGLGMDIGPESVVTGRDLDGQTPEQMEEAIRRAYVFARVAPNQKLELVKAAQRAGHFVAVTGDGVNDASALRAANIGVAMGKAGTDVAREAAEIVISDDNFSTIVAGVEEGRVAFDNVRNVIFLLISTGGAELIALGLAVILGLPVPLLPAQILWLNLVTNGIQGVALAFEPGDPNVLKRRPRAPSERIFNHLMIERTLLSAFVMGGIGLYAFAWMLENGWSEYSARNALLLLLVLFENIHIGNCRSETKSALFLSPFTCPPLLIGTLLAQIVHILVLYIPFGHAFLQTEPVSLTKWFAFLGVALSVFVVMEIHKWLWRIRYPKT